MSLYQGFYAIVVFWRKTCQAEIMMDRQGKLMKSSGLNFPVCKTVKSGKGCHLLTAHLKETMSSNHSYGYENPKKMLNSEKF